MFLIRTGMDTSEKIGTVVAVLVALGYMAYRLVGLREEWGKESMLIFSDSFRVATSSRVFTAASGAASPAHTLQDVSWAWRKTVSVGGEVIIAPHEPRDFIVTFDTANRVHSTTDCNTLTGGYQSDRKSLSVDMLAGTRMFCAGALESVYADQLWRAMSYTIEGAELSVRLKDDRGIMHFDAVVFTK